MKSILLFPLLLASALMAQEPDSSSALFSMRDAERNFARASVMYGRKAAFVENFADESVVFTNKWITNGKQFVSEQKANPVVLKWEPELMDIADSRDFGFSTGPWESQEYRPNTSPLATGYFLTVWKKQPDGVWKVILDAGLTTPPINRSQHTFIFPAGADKAIPDPAKIDVGLVGKELLDRENQLLTEWKKIPLASTYNSFLAHDARVQINGHLPSKNIDTINQWISKLDKTLIWKSAGSGAATSGDLGYTYGLLETSGTTEVTKGHYVRIWRKLPMTGWKIVMEMISID